MKINGYTIPLREVSYIVIATFWLAGLSFQGASNAEDIEKLSPTNERLARIEATQEATQGDVKEVKEEQGEQRKLLIKILEKVSD
ncbi:hypothetical protein LCGC14_2665450 [marine sediment metagenome]|uniref:Uncharacterized protein n=1 Tax=marine sediment metagenome TaxID=412755 RepID=A0A0F8ZQR9_9ZZZZ